MSNKEFLDKDGLLYYHSKIKETIPTKTSDLTNDSGFILEGQLAGAILSSDQPTDPAYSLWIEESDLGGGGGRGEPYPVDIIDVGTIVPFSGENIPNNWLLCDGSEVNRIQYKELFDIIGSTYGDGDGSITFNLPDFRGKVLTGLNIDDTDFNSIGKTGGEKTHKLTIDEMPSHKHKFDYWNNWDGSGAISYGSGEGAMARLNRGINWTNGNEAGMLNTGGDQSHNNLQPYVVVNYIIKYHKESTSVTATVEDNLNSSSYKNALSARQGKILNETKVSSTSIKSIEMVTEYPANPDPNILYIKVEA